MKRILIPLCIVVGSHVAYGQRSYQFDAPDRLFVEGKELFSLKNYAGCIDKLEAYKQHSTNADLIQEADYMLVYAAYEQGRPNADELLKDYLEEYPASRHSDEIGYMIGSVHFKRGEILSVWLIRCCRLVRWKKPAATSHGSSRSETNIRKPRPIMSPTSTTRWGITTML